MDSIGRFLKSISVTFGASQIMELLRAELEKTLGLRRVWLYRLSDDKEHLHLAAEVSPVLNQHVAGIVLQIEGDTYLEELLQANDLVVVEDARIDPRVNRHIVSRLQNRTVLNMPVEIQGRRFIIGSGTFGREGIIRLGKVECDYFRSMVNATAIAMDRAFSAEITNMSPPDKFSLLPQSLLAISFPMLTFWERDLRTGVLTMTRGCNIPLGYHDLSCFDTFEKYLEMVHPDDVKGLKTTVASYLAKPEGRLQTTYRLNHKNGAFRWFYSEGGLIYDEKNQPQKLAGFRFDITESRNSQFHISATEARLRHLFDYSEVSLWEIDLQSQPPKFSGVMPEYLGYDDSEITSNAREWLNFIHPDDVDNIHRQFREFIQGKSEILDSIIRIRHRNGSYCHIRSIMSLQMDSTGQPVRVIGSSINLTPAVLSETNLNSSHENFLMVVRESPVILALLDRQLNYLAVSKPWMNLFGQGYESVVGLNHYEIVPDLPGNRIINYQKALNGEFLQYDDQWERADGTSVWLRNSIGPWYDFSKNIGGVYILADDLTRIRELQSEVVEIAGQFRQRFSEDLHDTVCQELTALTMYAESLAESFGAEDERSRAILKRIDEGLNRSIRDVRQLMQGQMPVQVTGPGFVQAIQDLSIFDKMFNKCDIKVVVDSMPVNLDDFTATQLYLIVKEAVHNAIKHARPEEGIVIVSARPRLCVTVQNQLAEGQQSSVFKQKTGLGRKIMQHRAAMIGGLIRFESIENDRVQLTCEVRRIGDDC